MFPEKRQGGHEIMGHPIQRAIAALGAFLLSAIPTAAADADILVQAEDVIDDRPVTRPGYAFAEPREETANWASVNGSPNPGFPNAPGRFSVDFTDLPPGPYRVWVRLARYNGTPDTLAIPGAGFSDNLGHHCELTFAEAGAEACWRPFVMQPGGIVKAGGQWAWHPLFETGTLQGLYELTITGQTGPPGTGNYKGLWIDAIRFESVPGPRLPLPAGKGELPGRWQPGTWLTTSSPRRKGLAIAIPAAKDRVEASVLLRRTFDPPVATTGNDLCCVWIMAHQHVGPLQLALVDERGGRLQADLCQLADDRPLRLGMWYFILWPWRASLPKSTDAPRWAGFEVVSAAGTSLGRQGRGQSEPALGPESTRNCARTPENDVDAGAITLYGPTFTTVEAMKKSVDVGVTDYSEAAKESMRRSLAVHGLPRQGVEQDKRVILWAQGPYGGIPNAAIVKRRIAELYNSGADGIVLTANPVVDGKELYFPDEFFSPRRFRDEDFAACADDLRAVAWGPLTHSLLRFNVMPGTVDWFDAEWSAILDKARQAARMAKAGRLAGIMFDVEQYDWEHGVFRYDNRPLKSTKSLAEYAAQTRHRGAELAQALAAELPDIDILTTFGSSIGTDGGQLLVPFLEGMAGVKNCHVYDGCEPAYRFRTLRCFLEAAEKMRSASKTVGIGFGLWVNPPEWPFSWERPEENFRSPEGLVHSLHYALRLSDKYVWLYREGQLSLWPDTTPPGYYEAIRRARLSHDPAWVPAR